MKSIELYFKHMTKISLTVGFLTSTNGSMQLTGSTSLHETALETIFCHKERDLTRALTYHPWAQFYNQELTLSVNPI